MSDFKFICEHCGQKLRCDEMMSGLQINCPACRRTLTIPPPSAALEIYPVAPRVPSEAASTTAKPVAASPRTATAQSPPPPPPPREPSKTTQRAASPYEADSSVSGLAIASLVFACTALGFIPAIVCGHLAKQQLRTNPYRRGAQMATAGLVLGYAAALLSLGAAAFFLLSGRHAQPVVVGFDRNNAPDNPFAEMARQRAAEMGRPFGEHEEPATVSFVSFSGSAKNRSIKLRIANHSDKAIHALEMRLGYQDSAGTTLKRQIVTKSAEPSLANPATTVEVLLESLVVPDRTDSVEIVVTRADFGDGSRWKRTE